jgi:hypothetical protein
MHGRSIWCFLLKRAFSLFLGCAISGPNLALNEPFKKVTAYSASSARQETGSTEWEVLLAPKIEQRCGQDACVCLAQVIVHLRRARVTLFSMSSVVNSHYSDEMRMRSCVIAGPNSSMASRTY